MRSSALRNRRFGVAFAGLVLVVSGLAGAARAADDEFEFADALAKRGYTDLATEKFNALISDPKSTKDQKADGQYGLALLTYSDARILAADRNEKRRKPMKDVLARFDEADGAFAKFIQDNASHARNLEAKLSRGKLLQDKAEYVKVCIGESWLAPGESAATWQQKLAEWFDTAIKLFEDAEKKARQEREDLKSARKDSGDAWDEVNDRLGLVWLYRIAALYGKGSALPAGDPAATAALTQCVKEGSDDYQWDYGENVRGLWAMHFAGLANAALDKPAEAYSGLHTAGSFTAERDSSPAIQDVTFQSYRELGNACLKFGRREKTDYVKKCLEDFGHMEEGWPEWKKHPEGQRAGLVWAKLLEHSGQGPKALALVQDIIKSAEATNSPTRFEATRVLGDLIAKGAGAGGGSRGGGIALDPQTLTKIAVGKYRDADYAGAIHAFQVVLANCKDQAEWDEFGWQAWDYIGRCYGVLSRFWEAYLAFDQIEQAWRKDKNNATLTELTNETGFSRAAALDGLVRQTKDPDDRALAKQALDEFTRDHPSSPRNVGAEEAAAAAALKEAELVRSDPAAYKAALAAALKRYEDLKPSKTADKTKAILALIHQRMGDFEKAVSLADAWLAEKRDQSPDSAVRSAREEGRRTAIAVALTSRAERAAGLAKSPDRAAAAKANLDLLDAVDRLGPAFKEIAANGQTQLDQWRAEALIGAERVDDADQLVGKLLQENPDARNSPYLAAIMGAALERAALVRRSKDDENGYKQLMIRSARKREWVLDNSKTRDGQPAPRNPDVIRAVGDSYAEGGDFVKAEALLTEAQKAYDELAASATDPEVKKAAEAKSRSCRIQLIGLLTKQGKFDAAIPQLEKEIAADPKARTAFLKKIQTTDNIKDSEYRELVATTQVSKTLLQGLSEAYMKAPSKEHLFAAVNLAYILNLTLPKEEHHNAEYIDFLLRRAEAYLMLAEFTRLPDHYRAALATVRSQIVIPGYVDSYEVALPGSKKRGETIVGKAEDGLRKLGAK